MPVFDETFELGSIAEKSGVRIIGENWPDQAGIRVAGAGDFNGDGIDDIVLTALVGGTDNQGAAYVVFGNASGLPLLIDLRNLNGTNGFRIDGPDNGDEAGRSLSFGGDINGDGLADLVFGSSRHNNGYGGAFVVFGTSDPLPAVLDVADLDGDNGFRAAGGYSAYAAYDLDILGDVNGDGFADLLISAHTLPGTLLDSNGDPYSYGVVGGAYVVYGTDAGFPADIDLATLDGSNGFTILGALNTDRVGWSVSSAGDLNGDGKDDILVAGAQGTPGGHAGGGAYLIYGSDSFAAQTYVADLTAASGLILYSSVGGPLVGFDVAGVGDINGDGEADFTVSVVNNNRSAVYVVFGGAVFGAELDLDSLDGTNGFVFTSSGPPSQLGFSAASAGDINGDGFSDLVVGDNVGTGGGAAYILFGHDGPWAANLSTAALDGYNGFSFAGGDPLDGIGESVSAAGDVNGDGVDDLLISLPGADDRDDSGGAIILYGRVDRAGTNANDTLTGGFSSDHIRGGGGNDILYGMDFDDILDGGDLSDQLFGGDSNDSLYGGAGGDLLYGEAGDDNLHGGAGADKLFGGGDADGLYGDEGNDRLVGGRTMFGGDGNDLLDGGGFMFGGAGNDVFLVDGQFDQCTEYAGEGYDIVRTGILEWVLSGYIEALQFEGSANSVGTGSAEANNMQGNLGDNILYGMDGVDTLNGNDGDDTLYGGRGNDLMRGATGDDTFVVLQESLGNGAMETDTIYDFSTAEGDIIDLSAIDAYAGGPNVAFTYVGATFTRHAAEMTLTFAGGVTTLKLDVNGDGKADYQMRINGDVTEDSGGWRL